MKTENLNCTAFCGSTKIASGIYTDVNKAALHFWQQKGADQVLIFDDNNGQQLDLDFRESAAFASETLARSTEVEKTNRIGRPKLGVVSREVTLLPRHWDWLALQPGGASVTIRKLVEVARKNNDDSRASQEAAYRFMTAVAGNFTGFEEACRALFRAQPQQFQDVIKDWPIDVRSYINKLAGASMTL